MKAIVLFILTIYCVGYSTTTKADFNQLMIGVLYMDEKVLLNLEIAANALKSLEVKDYNDLYKKLAPLYKTFEAAYATISHEIASFSNHMNVDAVHFPKSAIVVDIPTELYVAIKNEFMVFSTAFKDLGANNLSSLLEAAYSEFIPQGQRIVMNFDVANNLVASFFWSGQDMINVGKAARVLSNLHSELVKSVKNLPSEVKSFVKAGARYYDTFGATFVNTGRLSIELAENLFNVPCQMVLNNNEMFCSYDTVRAFNAYEQALEKVQQSVSLIVAIQKSVIEKLSQVRP